MTRKTAEHPTVDKTICRKVQGKAEPGNNCLQTPGTCESCPEWAKVISPKKRTAEHPAAVIFRKRAKAIYAGMKKRAVKLPFDYESFEAWLVRAFGGHPLRITKCAYSDSPITAENFFVDHAQPISRGGSFELCNLALCIEKENLRKGNMTGEEWIRLRNYILAMPPEVSDSIMRRLAVGDVQRFAHFRRQRKKGK